MTTGIRRISGFMTLLLTAMSAEKCIAPGRQAVREVDLETRIGAERRDARECDTPICAGDHVAALPARPGSIPWRERT